MMQDVTAPAVAAFSDRKLRWITLIMAIACGLAAANVYYAQPLLALIARSFHISDSAATVVTTATQLGYALGLLFLVPLGDLINNRKLASRTMIGIAVALAVTAVSPVFPLFLIMAVLVGVTSVVAQILVPLAAHLAPEQQRGRVVGRVMSGLLLGILLARTVSSLVAAAWGWRSIYLISAALMVAMGLCLARVLPNREPGHTASYGQLMASVVRLLRTEPALRHRAFSQAMMFAAFTAFWSAIAYELISQHHLNQLGIGVFALVGAAGAAIAPVAGRLADAGHGYSGRAGAIALGMAALLIAAFGARDLILLGLAGVLLDVAVQAHNVLSQRDIYSLRPEARARVNTIFMSAMFIGGAISSGVAGWLHASYGWPAVALFGTALTVLAGMAWIASHVRSAAAASRRAPR